MCPTWLSLLQHRRLTEQPQSSRLPRIIESAVIFIPEAALGSPGAILFLCPHNAAKSVLAAAYFDRLARERHLDFRAASAGTSPDAVPSAAVVALLQEDGIDVSGHRPRRVTTEDMTNAYRVISLGCDMEELPVASALVDRWDDVPLASQDLDASRAAIRHHLDQLLQELAAAGRPLPSGD